MFKTLIFFLLLIANLFAINKEPTTLDKALNVLNLEINNSTNDLDEKLNSINKDLEKDFWYKKYISFEKYSKLKKELNSNKSPTEIINIKEQLNILADYKDGTFGDLLKLEEPIAYYSIDTPIMIFSAYNTIQDIKSKKDNYNKKIKELDDTINLLREKSNITNHNNHLENIIDNFEKEKHLYKEKYETYKIKSDENINKFSIDIEKQIKKITTTLFFIFFIIFISFIIKKIMNKYFIEQEKFYIASKLLNLLITIIILLIVLFNFISNISYLITLIGFVSAGIAIAFRDFFVAIIVWFVIIITGSIKVGDRIKIIKDSNIELVGDVLDISIFKMTLYEEVSSVSKGVAGQFVFIPNSFIFTNVIFNLTHNKMKHVWDGNCN